MDRAAATADHDRAILDWLERRPEQYGPRILDRLVPQDDGCREWALSVQTGGYGQIWLPGARMMVLVHRVVYLHEHGAIGAGMQIDHMCRNRRCANPDHLRELTPRDNIRNSPHYMKARCPAGHALTDGNLSPAHLARGQRTCLQCQKDREAVRDAAVREARELLGLTHRQYAARHGRGEAAARRIIEGRVP
jgi:hypothetical protein